MNRRTAFRLLTVTLLALCAAGLAQAAPTYCHAECTFSSCRTQGCTDPETGAIITCQQWGTYNFNDYDCDNVPTPNDNCPTVFNSGQQDCDGDYTGDACDPENGIFAQAGPASTCHIETESGYLPLPHVHFDHWVEAWHVDVSACSSPGKWITVVADTSTCWASIKYPWELPKIPNKMECCVALFDDDQQKCMDYLDNDQCHN